MITFTLKKKMKKGSAAGLCEAFHQTGKEHQAEWIHIIFSTIPITQNVNSSQNLNKHGTRKKNADTSNHSNHPNPYDFTHKTKGFFHHSPHSRFKKQKEKNEK